MRQPPKRPNDGGKKPAKNADTGAASDTPDDAAMAAAAAQAVANVRPEPVQIEATEPVLGTMDISALDAEGARGTDAQAIAAEDALPATGDTVSLTSDAVPEQFQQQLIDTARNIEGEAGTTGLKGAEPYGGWVYEEIIPQLRGMAGARFFKEMADNDSMCGAVLFALRTLMKKADWRVDPKNSTPEAQLAAERVQAALYEDMAQPWSQLVDEAASFLTYGYAPHEIIWKRCTGESDDPLHSSTFSDGVWAPAALPIRSQDTVWRWIFDSQGKGNLLGFEQLRIGYPNAVVPMAKALLFRTDTTRNNPEGRSVIRGAYVPYLRKKVIEEAEGRLALRSAGVVDIRIPAKFMDPGAGVQEKAIYSYYKAAAEKLAQDRQGSIVLPSDRDDKGNLLYDVKFLAADSRDLKDYSQIVERYDARIAVSALADFLLLGMKNVGSWALADSKTSLFVLAVDGFLAVIADQINRVLLRKMFRLNGWDMRLLPTVKAGSVQAADLAVLGPFFQQLSAAGAPFFPSPDFKLEQWLLEQAKAPSLAQVG